MQRRQFALAAGSICLSPILPTLAQASDYPSKPVRIVVPFSAGNTLDTALRVLAEEFRKNTGQPMVIEAKPGGGGIIAAQTVMTASPDGYTLLLGNTSMLTVNPHTHAKLPYDAENSFKPVTTLLGSALVMALHPSVPAKNLKEFIEWTKANPGKVSYASFTAGNSSHFAGVILNKLAGIDMVHVPFNGTPPAAQALVGGQVNAAFLPLQAIKPFLEDGRLKAIAISSPERSPNAPKLATFREQGYPALDIYIWASVMAPAATPNDVIAKLNEDLKKAMSSSQVLEKWNSMDFTALPSDPVAFKKFAEAESKRWKEAVKISGFRASE